MSTKRKRVRPNEQADFLSVLLGGVTPRAALLEIVCAYANGDWSLDGCKTSAIESIFGKDYQHQKGADRLALLFLRLTNNLGIPDATGTLTVRTRQNLDRVRAELTNPRTHRRFSRAVQWLCTQKFSLDDLWKLVELQKSGKPEWPSYPHLDGPGRRSARYFQAHGLRHFGLNLSVPGSLVSIIPRCIHCVDLFAFFLLIQCQGKPPAKMPIKVCPQCAKVFVPFGKTITYCSAECGNKAFWTPERKRDNIWVNRLVEYIRACLSRRDGFSPRDLSAKLKTSEERLQQVEIRWRSWEHMAKRVKEIRSAVTFKDHPCASKSAGV